MTGKVMKQCTICKETFPLTNFYIKVNGQPDRCCKPCKKEYNHKYYLEYRKPNRHDEKDIKDTKEEIILKHLESNPCSTCGDSSISKLKFYSNDGKEITKTRLLKRKVSSLRLYIHTLRTLCPECAKIRFMSVRNNKELIAKKKLIRKQIAALQINQSDLSIPEQFDHWIRFNYPWKHYHSIEGLNIKSQSGKELFECHLSPIRPYKGATYTIRYIATRLARPSSRYTQQDVEDWMGRLMELELKSMTYDW